MSDPNAPQLLLGLSRENYDRRGEVNFSTLKLLGTKSPEHYHAALMQTVSPDTDARKLGRAVHTASLEPERFRMEYVEIPASVGPRNAKSSKWIEFQKLHQGKELLTETMAKEAAAMQRAVRSCTAARQFLSGGKSEVTCVWPFVREQLGALLGFTTMCRSRLDFVANVGAIVDLKTTRDASPSGFGREVARYSYHVQAAFYQEAYFQVTGQRLPYKFVAIESAWPHVGAVYNVTPKAFDLGRSTYVDWLDRLQACRTNNHWPGYGEAEMDLELPAWIDPDDDENDDLSGLVTKEAA